MKKLEFKDFYLFNDIFVSVCWFWQVCLLHDFIWNVSSTFILCSLFSHKIYRNIQDFLTRSITNSTAKFWQELNMSKRKMYISLFVSFVNSITKLSFRNPMMLDKLLLQCSYCVNYFFHRKFDIDTLTRNHVSKIKVFFVISIKCITKLTIIFILLQFRSLMIILQM